MDIKDMINYGGFVVGIIGIILSIYLFKKGLEAKDPRCYYKTFKNISKISNEADSKIKIFYDQNEVTRVFTTYIWVWNNGKKPINKSDIPSQSSIKIGLRDDEFTPRILDYEVVKLSRSEINFSATRNGETELAINFDFLDQDDGAVLEIQHTGSIETELESEGVILGVPEGLKIIKKQSKKSVFARTIMRASALMDMKNLKKNPRAFYSFSFLLVIMIIIMFGFMMYDINYNSRITVTPPKLSEALSTEFPMATEQNISNVIENLKNDYTTINQFLFIFMGGYLLVLIGMLFYIARKDVIAPYPKTLNLGDNLLKFSKEKEAG